MKKWLKTFHRSRKEVLIDKTKDEFAKDFEELSKLIERQTILSKHLDLSESVVYVTNMSTNEIMFVNNYAKEMFKDDEPIVGKLCHEVFQKDSHPCEFCNNADLAQELEKPITWVYHNKVHNKTFLIEDMAYKVNGYMVRIEHATEITEKLKEQINGQ